MATSEEERGQAEELCRLYNSDCTADELAAHLRRCGKHEAADGIRRLAEEQARLRPGEEEAAARGGGRGC